MTDDGRDEFESGRSFRSIRRRSGSGSTGDSPFERTPRTTSATVGKLLDNIFNFDDEAQPPEPKPAPAHVEAEARSYGKVRVLAAPDHCPASLKQSLSAKMATIGRFCQAARLFEAEYDGGETSLMVCFTEVDPANVARVEGAVADALMASGFEDLPLGVLFLSSDSGTFAKIEPLAFDLLSER